MCGLTGFFRPGDPDPPPEAERRALVRMNNAIIHRGPDEDGTWFGPGVGLAARRLSIIDIDGSQQPRCSPSGRTVCVFNGEIYNFRELRQELEQLGHTFQTAGDTELLPIGYEEWGINGLLGRLNGMFAFVLFDADSRDLYIARDRMGIKPIYIGHFGNTWLFGSELKSLLEHPTFQRDVDPVSLSRYLISEYVAAPRSIYRNVEKLRPGHYLHIDAKGGERRERYWQLRWGAGQADWAYPELPLPRPGDESAAAWVPVLLQGLREAIRLRLVAEVPIGALLSGGVDSSSVSALMAEMVPDLRTFSIAFEEQSFDERQYSQAVARHIHSKHHARVLEPSRIRALLEDVLGFLDEPLADASILPTHFLSRTVKEQGVTVVLSGDGADELFAGYPTYLAHRAARAALALPAGGQLLASMAKLSNLLPSSYENLSADYITRRFLQGASLPTARRHASWMGAFLEPELLKLLNPDVLASLAGSSPWQDIDDRFREGQAAGARGLEQLLHLDAETYLSDDILVKVDRASMATSLEVRTPFLDHRLVELASRMPAALKLRGRRGKYVLKQAIGPHLPQGITKRRKKGFGMPVAHWLRGPMRDLLLDTLSAGAAGSSGWFCQSAVDQLINDHLSGRLDRRKPLWTLLMFRWWEQGSFGPGAGQT
ncbi:MAG: asparagine synthase (glutamine-hydrolyzing) [Rickettsiales bacterium]|nr:asparagine synthase (glutamine-hydrolyzing) [Rickettsiales bacterium]